MSWLPQIRKDFLEDQELYRGAPDLLTPEDVVIRRNVDWLIEHLYEPDAEIGAVASGRQFRRAGLTKEVINWGDLGCSEIRPYADGSWEIVIEEANPDSPVLCGYIRKWMTTWGWIVNVRTEW